MAPVAPHIAATSCSETYCRDPRAFKCVNCGAQKNQMGKGATFDDTLLSTRAPPGFVPCGPEQDYHSYVCDKPACRRAKENEIRTAAKRMTDEEFAKLRGDIVTFMGDSMTKDRREQFQIFDATSEFKVFSNQVCVQS